MILFPHCKINIGLDVISRRPDGYHELETVMVPVTGLCDILEIVPRSGTGAEFISSGLAVDCPPEKNLCLKAYNLLAGRYDIGGVRMHLHKLTPFGAGLGGGSSDAAFVIKGLDRIFNLGLGRGAMESLAAELGSDTPFFIGDTAQTARGRGEILSPTTLTERLRGKLLVIVKPPFGISTAEAYAGISPHQPATPLTERLDGDIGIWKNSIRNDFEPHIFAAYPILGDIKKAMYDTGAIYASMSGSGPAAYGLFEPPEHLTYKPLHTPIPDLISGKLRAMLPEAFVYQEIIK